MANLEIMYRKMHKIGTSHTLPNTSQSGLFINVSSEARVDVKPPRNVTRPLHEFSHPRITVVVLNRYQKICIG